MFPDQNQIASIGDGPRRWSFFRRQQPFSKKSHLTYLIETHVTIFIQLSSSFFSNLSIKKKYIYCITRKKPVNRQKIQDSTCSLVKPLSKRYLSKDIILVTLDISLGAYLPSSSSVFFTDVCFFRDAKYLLSAARKSGNSNSTQKIAAVIQVNKTNANRASRENLRIMHSFYTNCRETTGAY